ncbi:MAG: hypothetical protein VX768_17875 [Planctomycetota bacterium]|nr:hypothetical protein [Planctomycetota bacterium]
MKSNKASVCGLLCFSAILFVSSATQAQEWGSIKGKFVAAGKAPSPAEIIPDKDKAACKLPMYSRTLMVGKDGGVKNIVVFLKKPSSPVKVHPDIKLPSFVELDNKNCRFEPHIVIMTTGQKLRVKNSDNVGHNANVTSFNDENSHNPNIPAGKHIDLEMSVVESRPINVACNSHAWMKAHVLVRDEPYMAVSAANGEFEIKNLPAGKHTFQFWHENAGYVKNGKVNGKKIASGRRAEVKVEIEAGGTLDLGVIEIPVEDISPKE